MGDAELSLSVEFRVDQFAEPERQTVREVVEYVSPFATGRKHAAFHEFAEVFGHVGLGGPDGLDDFGDAACARAKGLEDG